MTPQEMLAELKVMTGETDETMLSVYLKRAASVVIKKAYPFRTDITAVPEWYQEDQLTIADYLYHKRGAEGETVHNENGINRSYESAYVPASMLSRIIPESKVPQRREENEGT